MTADTVLAQRIFDALRSLPVSSTAGVAAATWAATDYPRIFRGLAGFLGGRNRGRMPFIEFDIANSSFAQESPTGGTLVHTVTLRVHYGSRDNQTASEKTSEILTAGLAALRSEATDNLCAIGGDQIGPLAPSPWGLSRDATVTVEQSFSRETYEVQ